MANRSQLTVEIKQYICLTTKMEKLKKGVEHKLVFVELFTDYSY